MDRLESVVKKLTEAVYQLTDIVPQPHTAKTLVYGLIQECQDILDNNLTLEEGDAPGPSAAIVAAAEAINKGDPEGPLDLADRSSPEAPANAGGTA